MLPKIDRTVTNPSTPQRLRDALKSDAIPEKQASGFRWDFSIPRASRIVFLRTPEIELLYSGHDNKRP
jgi:hypothetical protein